MNLLSSTILTAAALPYGSPSAQWDNDIVALALIAPLPNTPLPALRRILILLELQRAWLIFVLLSSAAAIMAAQSEVAVTTAKGLRAAVRDGVRHIVIREHLDMQMAGIVNSGSTPGDSVLSVGITDSIRV